MNELHKLGALIAIIIISLIALIGYTYFLETSNQNPDKPTPTPTEEVKANLIANIKELCFATDGGLRLIIYGDIENIGDKTAYKVSLHIQTWFSNGTKGIDITKRLNKEKIWILPFRQVDISGGETYSLTSRYFSGDVITVPGEFWLDEWGEVYPYDLISTYLITPLWDDTS